MDETGMGNSLILKEQALMLLDQPENKERRRKLDLFLSPETFIFGSFAESSSLEKKTENTTSAQAFSVAARLSSDRYEERAKADALYEALKALKHRNRSFGSGKVIRAK